MTLTVLTSASGAPGVSTSSLGLALAWPRPVLLVEADPTGGSAMLAGWFHGRPPHDRGLVDLAMAHSQGDLRRALPTVVIRIPNTSVDLISGVRSPTQAAAVAPLWPAMATALRTLDGSGVDVLVDAGRLGLVNAPTALLDAADAVLLTCRATLPAISAARGWARELTERFTAVGTAQHLGLLVVGPGHTFGAGEVKGVLGLPLIATLPWDPKTAQAIHLGETSRRLSRGPLARALHAGAAAVSQLAAENRERLAASRSLPVEAGR
ncbi:MAG: hypothetical protein WAL50_06800 [Kineosporiaceae bacterium]